MSTISAGTTSTTTLVHSGDTTGSLVFKTNDTGSGGTTAVTIDTSQRVGIGTTTPTNILEIVNASNPTIRITDTTNNCYTELNATDNGGYVGTASNHWFAFVTNNTERMRIDTSGNLLVGTTSADIIGANSNGVTYRPASASFSVNAVSNPPCNFGRSTSTGTLVNFFYNAAVKGTISTDGSTTAYNTSSDYRLKHDIVPMTGALAKVSALKPCTYKWNSDNSNGEGFIAHELAEVVPQCVTGEKDAVDADGNPVYQGIDTSFLVATLTAALQEAHGLIKDLQTRVATLEAK